MTHELSLMSEESQTFGCRVGSTSSVTWHTRNPGLSDTGDPSIYQPAMGIWESTLQYHPSSTWIISHHSTSIATHRVCSTNQRAVHPPRGLNWVNQNFGTWRILPFFVSVKYMIKTLVSKSPFIEGLMSTPD